MELIFSNFSIFLIGVLSSLFIFSSTILSKICGDEKSNSKNFILIAKICIILSSLIVILIFKELLIVGIILLGYFGAEMIISKFLSLNELKQYYLSRSLNYVIIYILLFIQPLMVLFPVVYEFFRTSFNNFKPRFEILLFVGYIITLAFVFLL